MATKKLSKMEFFLKKKGLLGALQDYAEKQAQLEDQMVKDNVSVADLQAGVVSPKVMDMATDALKYRARWLGTHNWALKNTPIEEFEALDKEYNQTEQFIQKEEVSQAEVDAKRAEFENNPTRDNEMEWAKEAVRKIDDESMPESEKQAIEREKSNAYFEKVVIEENAKSLANRMAEIDRLKGKASHHEQRIVEAMDDPRIALKSKTRTNSPKTPQDKTLEDKIQQRATELAKEL
jgi:hypothetical protein